MKNLFEYAETTKNVPKNKVVVEIEGKTLENCVAPKNAKNPRFRPKTSPWTILLAMTLDQVQMTGLTRKKKFRSMF